MNRDGADIEAVRAALGLTRDVLAERSGVSAALIYDIEKGRVKYSTTVVAPLWEAMELVLQERAEFLARYFASPYMLVIPSENSV